MESFGILDSILWSMAFALALLALYLARPQPRRWQPLALFRGIQGQPDPRWDLDWQPSAWLGAGLTWADLSTTKADPALHRRLDGLQAFWLETPCLELPGIPNRVAQAGVEASIEQAIGEHRRLVLVARVQTMELLKLMHRAPGLRDRTRAVLMLSPELDQQWLKQNFNHVSMDTELYRAIPYLLLSKQEEGVSLEQPPEPPNARTSIEVIHLGPPSIDDPQQLRSIALLLAAIG